MAAGDSAKLKAQRFDERDEVAEANVGDVTLGGSAQKRCGLHGSAA